MITKFAGRNMKRTAAVLLCSAALVLPALAQSGATGSGPGGPGGRRGGPEQRLQMMTQELNLTADQVAKVKTIFEEGRAQMMAQRDSTAPQEDRRAKMMADRQAEVAKIKAVLTPDQVTKFDAMEARMRERMRDGRGNGDAPPPPPPPQ